jgi:hypothetical protein
MPENYKISTNVDLRFLKFPIAVEIMKGVDLTSEVLSMRMTGTIIISGHCISLMRIPWKII